MRATRALGPSAAAALVAGVVGIAAAHDKDFSNAVVVSSAVRSGPTTGDYEGRVTSGSKSCRRNRLVKIIRDSNPRILIGTGPANASGKWALSGPAPPDGHEVFATIARKVVAHNRRHFHRCKAARSPNRVFPSGGG